MCNYNNNNNNNNNNVLIANQICFNANVFMYITQ